MKTAENVPSVWPGYVAAIASLVLSLLLLLAILVFALTQVGHLVSAYMQTLLQETLQDVPSQPVAPQPPQVQARQGASAPSSRSSPVSPTSPVSRSSSLAAGAPVRQVRLVFAADLADIPAAQLAEVVSLLRQMQAPSDGSWSIWSPVLSGDALMARSAYRLMWSVRQTLIAQGASEKHIGLQLKPSDTAPPNYDTGEIVVYVAPVHLLSRERGKP